MLLSIIAEIKAVVAELGVARASFSGVAAVAALIFNVVVAVPRALWGETTSAAKSLNIADLKHAVATGLGLAVAALSFGADVLTFGANFSGWLDVALAAAAGFCTAAAGAIGTLAAKYFVDGPKPKSSSPGAAD